MSNEQRKAEALAVPSEIAIIIENLHTQDNRITDNPLFAVQQKRRVYGVDDDHKDGATYITDDGVEFDALQQNTRKVGYLDRWEFVTGCMTEQGCKDYIACNGHNLHEPRIYAYGSYRNAEFIALRKWLMSLRGLATPTDSAANAELRSVYETLETIAAFLNIDLEAAKKAPSKPSDVYIAAIKACAANAGAVPIHAMVDAVMNLADRYAHVYSFVGDDTMPKARAELAKAVAALVAPAVQEAFMQPNADFSYWKCPDHPDSEGYVFKRVDGSYVCGLCWKTGEFATKADSSEPRAYNRAREMADRVYDCLDSIGTGWDEDDIDEVQGKLLPEVYDCLNLLAMAHDASGSPAAARAGEVLGSPHPDWPEDLQTFAERSAYQRGVADARRIATLAQAGVSDAEIEKLAVEYEAFGFGQVDAKGYTTHGFDPDGLGRFARAVLALHGISPAPKEGGE